MNSCQYVAAFLIVVFISINIVFVKPAELPRNNTQRWIRSLITGFCYCTAAFFALVGLLNNNSPCWAFYNPIKLKSFWGLGCLLFPLMIMATVGTYISYGQLKWLLSLKEKIRTNSKKVIKK